MLHKDPREALIVGFGMGITSYGATLYENVNVTCVELVKNEIETAPYFGDLNKDVLTNPKFHFVHDDGRDQVDALAEVDSHGYW